MQEIFTGPESWLHSCSVWITVQWCDRCCQSCWCSTGEHRWRESWNRQDLPFWQTPLPCRRHQAASILEIQLYFLWWWILVLDHVWLSQLWVFIGPFLCHHTDTPSNGLVIIILSCIEIWVIKSFFCILFNCLIFGWNSNYGLKWCLTVLTRWRFTFRLTWRIWRKTSWAQKIAPNFTCSLSAASR